MITLIAKKSNISVTSHTHDDHGRLLVTHLQRGDDPIHVVNIYGPNADEPDFWEKVSNTLEGLPQEDLIIAGSDFNLPLDPHIDHQSKCNYQPSRSHEILRRICSRFNLKDSWRLQHPDTRDFTFYSAPHNSYSRINYLLISSSFTHLIDETDIAPKLVSDHACISTKLAGTHRIIPTKRWRFNDDILADPANKLKIEKAIQEYITLNDIPDMSISTVWDALKATIRGVIIGIKAQINKKLNIELNSLEKEIKSLEISHSMDTNNKDTLDLLIKKSTNTIK